jgi:GT2 family glycosyltransferase
VRPAEKPVAYGGAVEDSTFSSLLHDSLFEVLNESLKGAASDAAAGSLRTVRDAVRAGDLGNALRNLDRAWRCLPEDAAILAPIYGRLLILDARDDDAALRLLCRAIDSAPDPDVAALIALALFRLQRAEDGRRQLQAALQEYCVAPGGVLFHVAGTIVQLPAAKAPGWIGRGPKLELVGEFAPDEPSNQLEIRLDGRLIRLPVDRSPGDPRVFSVRFPQAGVYTSFEASSRGVPLIGGEPSGPANFRLDGRIESRGSDLLGWARVGWSPMHPVQLRIEDEEGHRKSIWTRRAPDPGRRWPFKIDLGAGRLRGGQIRVSAQLPDGRWQPLPGSPLLLETAIRLPGEPPARLPAWDTSPSDARLDCAPIKPASVTDVIIPVYRGLEETLACIDAVLATVDDDTPIVVVDDASDDPALAAALDTLGSKGRITLLRNASNHGFAASVNRGLALHPTHDAVLLNSDTRVFDDWLVRLRAAAYSGKTVGTVTPFSNFGSIASYPRMPGAAIDPDDVAALHALTAAAHSGTRVEIPVGVGFCLYLRRDCLADVGSLDAAVFDKGYGEETDFCLRARHRGWSNLFAADVFVYHAGGLSFGSRRAALLDRSQRLLNLRHPGYDDFIASYLAADPLRALRRRLDEHRLLAFQGRFVLMVTHPLTGGVDRFVTERCRDLRAQGLYPLVLKAAAAGDSRRCELSTDALDVPNLNYEIPQDLTGLSALLRGLRVDAIEIQHFLNLDAQVIDAVRALPIPYDVFVHDYAWICPRVTLIDGSGRYCGEPALSVCEACVSHNGSNLGETISVTALRARSAAWLRGARRVIAPSADTAARLRRHFGDLTVAVQGHAPSMVSTGEAPVFKPLPPAAQAGPVRVVLIGAIGEHKGYRILLECARDARVRRLPIEFVVVGYTENDAPLLEMGNVFITGRYSEAEAVHLLRREQPALIWLPSVWPETWCYTLDYALATGLPVAAFDLGAIAERLRAKDQGELLALDMEPAQINDRLLEIGGSAPYHATPSRSEQSSVARPSDVASMAESQYGDTSMTDAPGANPAEGPKEEGLSASVQVLPLAEGLYLFSVKAAGPSSPTSNGELSLPAMHVGVGPGVRPEQVEFIAGPCTHGAWLFAASDLLVTRINTGGAMLILTSVRAPGGEVLSIKVERLNSRANSAAITSTRLPTLTDFGSTSIGAPTRSVFDAARSDDLPLALEIGAHIRTRGDMTFADKPWAGRVAPGLWIESFSVRSPERFGTQDIEYKGLTGSGFETPWLSGEQSCGTQGMAVPLVGFALRLKPNPATAPYDCEYSGYFQSGLTVGPLRSGAPCRSTVANDPLEGIQISLVARSQAAAPTKRALAKRAPVDAPTSSALDQPADAGGKGVIARKPKSDARADTTPTRRGP